MERPWWIPWQQKGVIWDQKARKEENKVYQENKDNKSFNLVVLLLNKTVYGSRNSRINRELFTVEFCLLLILNGVLVFFDYKGC